MRLPLQQSYRITRYVHNPIRVVGRCVQVHGYLEQRERYNKHDASVRLFVGTCNAHHLNRSKHNPPLAATIPRRRIILHLLCVQQNRHDAQNHQHDLHDVESYQQKKHTRETQLVHLYALSFRNEQKGN